MSEQFIKYHFTTVQIIIDTNIVTNNIINKDWSFLNHDSRYLVITDTNLAKEYKALLSSIPNLETILAIKPGEKAKTFAVYEKIITNLTKMGFTKNDILIGFGGGVIMDLTNFVASTYLNGVNFIQIPTSLVAQVNAGIGGKAQMLIDNYISISNIYQPQKIIIDPSLLKTLPKTEFDNGIAEIIKLAMIKSPLLFDELLNNDFNNNYPLLPQVIEKCANLKINLTSKDEMIKKEARLLEFGQTYGDIIKKLTNNKLSYGKNLGLGMYFELNNQDLKVALKELLLKYQLFDDINKYNIDFNKYLFKERSLRQITRVNIDKIGKGKIITETFDF